MVISGIAHKRNFHQPIATPHFLNSASLKPTVSITAHALLGLNYSAQAQGRETDEGREGGRGREGWLVS